MRRQKARLARGAPTQAAPSEDSTAATYRAMHDTAVAQYNQAIALARAAAQSGNSEAVAGYVKLAQDAAKRADNLKATSIRLRTRRLTIHLASSPEPRHL
jgi:hypothetical protein